MRRVWLMLAAAVAMAPFSTLAQQAARPKFDAFEVATIKPVDPDAKPADTSSCRAPIGLSRKLTL